MQPTPPPTVNGPQRPLRHKNNGGEQSNGGVGEGDDKARRLRRAQCDYVRSHKIHVALDAAVQECVQAQPEDPAEFLAEYFLNLAVEVRKERKYVESVSTPGHERHVDMDMLVSDEIHFFH
eukprot:PhF_6_TR29286/c0_g1_i1/m.42916